MAESSKTFIDQHDDFVLKLKIKGVDGAVQIRRVRLPRIADSSGNLSYEELVGLVVTFTFAKGSPENYQVSLTYCDVDEDAVTIASTDELVDAIEQFAGTKILRITTEVKPKTKESTSKPSSAPSSPSSAGTTDRGTSTQEPRPAQPQIQNVLESFVGVLATAVTSLQEGLAAPASRGATPEASRSAKASSSETSSKTASEDEAEKPPCSAAKTQNKDQDQKTEVGKEPRPFIHGRHTCDSCLTTPIVGNRYHAVNLPDYDLCGNCHKNYKGSEVRFAAVELDRDRAFQERWYRRREKMQKFESRRANRVCHGRGRGRRHCGPGPKGRGAGPRRPNHDSPPCPPPPPCMPPYPPPCPPPHHPPHGPPPFAPPHHPSHGPPPFAPPHHPPHGPPHWAHLGPHMGPHLHHPVPSEFDTALTEAIRRSLKDIAPNEAQIFAEANPAPASVVQESEPEIVVEPAVEVPADVTAETEHVEDVAVVEDDVVEPAVDLEQGLKAAAPEDSSDGIVEQNMETASVDSAKLVKEESEMEQKPKAVTRENSDSPCSEMGKDESFASDAVGSGDIAEAMGATLDMVAGMISDMLSEADSHSDNLEKTEAEAKEEKLSQPSGALIIKSTDQADDTKAPCNEPEAENDWEVVAGSEEGADKSGNDIGRAAEMLGSALFNSDMKSADDENVSHLSDSFSVPSTVPSISGGTTGSQVAPAQRDRWVSQLSQLRELGFDDESLCVEILERLQAANIGVDSGDDVSVAQVVNTILEGK